MKAVVEFIGYFRMKAGCEFIEAELGEQASVLELINLVERQLAQRSFHILENEEPIDGVLLFSRKDGGGMERIFDLSAGLKQTGGRIIVANLMGGG